MGQAQKRNRKTLAVIGLGKVGLPLAASLASSGSLVLGYDTDPNRAELLKSHDPEQNEIQHEKRLSQFLTDGVGNLSAVDSIAEAIAASAISFVIVPTPSLEDGSFSPSYVEHACFEIGKSLRDKTGDHLVVLVSTVSPGATADTIVPLLERVSGKSCGKGFGFCYSPALIALGDVIRGFLEPDFAFVGEVDQKGADQLVDFYSDLFPPGTPLHRMSAQSVEIAKIALNNFLTMKIGFSNLIGRLCDRTPNANARDVLGALGDDERIGKKFLNAGMGFGGPCLPRDNAALCASFGAVGIHPYLPDAIARCNADHTVQLAMLADDKKKVTVLGLGYKSGTPVTSDSASIALCNALIARDRDVCAFDPLAGKMDLHSLHQQVIIASTLGEALEQAEIIYLTVDHKTMRNLSINLPDNARLIDVSGGFENVDGSNHVHTFGKH